MLTAAPSAGKHVDVAFNERFRWERPTQMRDEYRAALVKGEMTDVCSGSAGSAEGQAASRIPIVIQ